MIDGLIAGRLHTQPKTLVGKAKKAFVVAKIRAVAGDGTTLFVNAICFEPQACEQLLALQLGDAVAVSGAISPKAWTDKEGAAKATMDVNVSVVLSEFHLNRKRKAMEPEPEGPGEWDGGQDGGGHDAAYPSMESGPHSGQN